MKKIVITACIMTAASLSVISCQKNESDTQKDDPTALKIEASKTNAKVGESVTIQVKNADADLVAVWNVTPASSATLSEKYSSNQKNTISFSAAGSYTVTADLKKVSCDTATVRALGMDSCLKMAALKYATSVKIEVGN